MRVANVVVVALGVGGFVLAGLASWRWRHLPLRRGGEPPDDRLGVLGDAVRTLGAVASAGVVAGVLVLGLGGRLVMRLLAATSGGRVQGRLTEAGESVGEITSGGTIAFLLFVGVFGGLVSALGYLVVRRWLPRTAGRAGLVSGAILIGTIGVLDPFSPDNVDFEILRPRWLAIVLVLATGVLFATTLTALARAWTRSLARTERAGGCRASPSSRCSSRRSRCTRSCTSPGG